MRLRYTRLLIRALRHPWVTVMAVLAVFGLAIGALSSGHIRFEFFKGDPQPIFYVNVEMPPGTPLEQTVKTVHEIERITRAQIRPEELRATVAYAGQMFAQSDTLFGDVVGQVMVSLNPTVPGAREVFAIAEANGGLVALDAWALVNAFRLRAGWPRGGPYLSVNVSAAGLLAGHAAPMLRAAFAATGTDPRGVVIELPEGAVARDIPAARALAAELRSIGASVALDDFGGAHGAARILRDIPFAAVKLDAALTDGLDGDGPEAARARAMVAAIVEMVHAMGATVTAEAVESAAQMRALRDAGCDALQGWLLGRPGPLA